MNEPKYTHVVEVEVRHPLIGRVDYTDAFVDLSSMDDVFVALTGAGPDAQLLQAVRDELSRRYDDEDEQDFAVKIIKVVTWEEHVARVEAADAPLYGQP